MGPSTISGGGCTIFRREGWRGGAAGAVQAAPVVADVPGVAIRVIGGKACDTLRTFFSLFYCLLDGQSNEAEDRVATYQV